MVKLITQTPPGIVNSKFSICQANWDNPDHLAVSQLSMHKLFKTVAIENSEPVQALPFNSKKLDISGMVMDDPLMQGRKISSDIFLNRRLYNDALLVMHKGKVIHESYRNGMCDTDHHVVHSCTKSLCSMILAMAVDAGLVDPDADIKDYIPEFRKQDAWQGVTVQHVWDMQAGIAYDEDYTNPNADYWSYARAAGYYPPLENEEAVGVKAWVFANLIRRDHPPGKVFTYNSTLTIVLGILLENVYGEDLANLFETKLYSKIGAEQVGYFNTDPIGFPIVEGQLNLTLRDFSRLGVLMANGGKNLHGE
jgi:CubicO group peptidase (beta-lactamase class C family)